jgi:hypothetical protein
MLLVSPCSVDDVGSAGEDSLGPTCKRREFEVKLLEVNGNPSLRVDHNGTPCRVDMAVKRMVVEGALSCIENWDTVEGFSVIREVDGYLQVAKHGCWLGYSDSLSTTHLHDRVAVEVARSSHTLLLARCLFETVAFKSSLKRWSQMQQEIKVANVSCAHGRAASSAKGSAQREQKMAIPSYREFVKHHLGAIMSDGPEFLLSRFEFFRFVDWCSLEIPPEFLSTSPSVDVEAVDILMSFPVFLDTLERFTIGLKGCLSRVCLKIIDIISEGDIHEPGNLFEQPKVLLTFFEHPELL